VEKERKRGLFPYLRGGGGGEEKGELLLRHPVRRRREKIYYQFLVGGKVDKGEE